MVMSMGWGLAWQVEDETRKNRETLQHAIEVEKLGQMELRELLRK